MLAIPGLAVSLAFYPLIISGFSFSINNTPQQCQNLSISITGSGQPPYNAVILPFGPTPLSNNTEVRKILHLPFSGDSTSLSFQLTYPENSQFVVVVSFMSFAHRWQRGDVIAFRSSYREKYRHEESR
jgi:hypothetical protein